MENLKNIFLIDKKRVDVLKIEMPPFELRVAFLMEYFLDNKSDKYDDCQQNNSNYYKFHILVFFDNLLKT